MELLESRAWEVLVDLQDRMIRNPAYGVLQTSSEVNEMLRAQGVLKGFRDLDGLMKRLFQSAKEERERMKGEALDE